MMHMVALVAALSSGAIGSWVNEVPLPVQTPLRPVEQMEQPPAPSPANATTQTTAADDIDFRGQLVHTVIALAILVVALYILGRVILPRFLKITQKAAGKQMHVVERVALDQKHALYVVDVEGMGRLLVGTAEHNIQLIFSSPQAGSMRYATDQSRDSSAFAAQLFRSAASSAVTTVPHQPAGDEVMHGKSPS